MKQKAAKNPAPPLMQERLSELEDKAAQRGIQIHYDLLEAAGLKLKDGICKINGEYHIFVDRRKSLAEKIEILDQYLAEDLPEEPPQIQE